MMCDGFALRSAELLLIMWGLAFIAVGEEGPNLKGRNFKKTARKGIRAVQSVTVRGKPGSGSDEGDFSRDEVPTWERMAPGTGQEVCVRVCMCVHGVR